MSQLIVTALGPDRPGIVGQLTEQIHRAGGNLLDSRMVNLRGQFAMMILLECDMEAEADLSGQLEQQAKQMGLQLSLTPQQAVGTLSGGRRYRLKTYSLDQPGIVARLATVLREFEVNIEELSARQESAPFDGSALFTAEMQLTLPPQTSVRALRTALDQVCGDLNCDIDLDADE